MGVGVMAWFGRDFTTEQGMENRFEKTGKEGGKDRSREMKKKRGAFKKLYNKYCKSGKIGQAVEEAFSLNMDLE